jgi:hypothetical protein
MTPLEKLGIPNPLQATQLLTTLENIEVILAAAIAGDETILPTQAAAFDISTETATASAQLAHITKTLRSGCHQQHKPFHNNTP